MKLPHPAGPVPLTRPARLALVGDRSAAVRAHQKIPVILEALGGRDRGAAPIELYWLASRTIGGPADLDGFDGVWGLPGSPYENPDGVLAAITAARTSGTPYLGTCGGLQHLLLEFARQVCGLTRVAHGEEHPDAEELLLVPLRCSLLGEEATVVVDAGTLAAQIMGAGPSTERFFCRYGLNPDYLEVLVAHGLVLSGRDQLGEPRIVELPGHPFFLGALFQPELSSDSTWVHPLLAAFAEAVRKHAAGAGVPVPVPVPVPAGVPGA